MVLRRMCDVANLANFCHYYLNGWVGWPDGNVILPMTVYNGPRTEEDDVVQMRCLARKETDKGAAYALVDKNIKWDDMKKNALFGRPDVGMVSDGPTILYMSHRSTRNSQRGLRLDKVVQHSFNNWHIRGKRALDPRSRGVEALIGRYDLIWEVFNPRRFGLTEALTRLGSGEAVGAAVSQFYGIYTVPDGKFPLLAYKRWTIGYVRNSSSVHIDSLYTDYVADIKRKLGVTEVTVS